MDLRSLILNVLDNYQDEKKKPLKNNKFAEIMHKGLSNSVAEEIQDKKLTSNGSVGIGRWANIPWIGVFDADITDRASDGFYIVYLFSKSSNTVYLSLIQSWTMYKKKFPLKTALKKIQIISKYLCSILETKPSSINKDSIVLIDDGTKKDSLSRGYELGTIINIKYDKNSLPDNITMMNDLREMVTVYRELKSKLISSNSNININFFLSSYNKLKYSNETKNSNFHINDSASENHNYIARKTDFKSLNKNNSEIGFVGENEVFEMEKEKLANYPDLQKHVEHVSVTKGDGLGYDIKSFNTDGSTLYIEVKTTKSDINQPFYISNNELNFSNDNPNNYKLIRLYDLTKSNNSETIKFHKYELNGSLSNSHNLLLKPSTYIAQLMDNDHDLID